MKRSITEAVLSRCSLVGHVNRHRLPQVQGTSASNGHYQVGPGCTAFIQTARSTNSGDGKLDVLVEQGNAGTLPNTLSSICKETTERRLWSPVSMAIQRHSGPCNFVDNGPKHSIPADPRS